MHYVDYDAAIESADNGAILLDVRTADEFSNSALRHSTNMPLATIRESMKKLDATKRYMVCCDTGRRSAAAAFLLGQRGFDVAVIEGGLNHARLADPALDAGLTLSIAPMDETSIAPSPAPQPARSTRTSGGGEANALRRQLADVQAGETAARARVGKLQKELATLKAELQKYTDKVMQVEVAHQGERLARERLSERIEQLIAALEDE